MNIIRFDHYVLFVAVFFSTTGFTEFFIKEDVYNQTESVINEVKLTTKPSAEITGFVTKELAEYRPYNLTNTDNDPFAVKAFVEELGQMESADDNDSCETGECGDGPPMPHSPFFLENYSLDQLALTGTMSSSNKGKVALIMTPDSGIVYASVGEYIGRQNGLIIAIDREKMIIQEKYRTAQGWQNRNAALPLIRN